MISVVIPGPPCAQGRGRAVRVGAGVRVIDPKKSRNWKATAQWHMKLECPTPLDGPLAVEILAVFPCPMSDYRKSHLTPRRWHIKNTDWDNLGKCVCDAGNGVLWMDDRQVCHATLKKVIAAQDEPPFVSIKVWQIQGEPQ